MTRPRGAAGSSLRGRRERTRMFVSRGGRREVFEMRRGLMSRFVQTRARRRPLWGWRNMRRRERQKLNGSSACARILARNSRSGSASKMAGLRGSSASMEPGFALKADRSSGGGRADGERVRKWARTPCPMCVMPRISSFPRIFGFFCLLLSEITRKG
ncbi:hypothetical protein LY76DRAFT_401607 [Colletotrichum caudatum]|nr:hypothetical protein LY76DRAFT_401607 [Colletotrichum caudatum]